MRNVQSSFTVTDITTWRVIGNSLTITEKTSSKVIGYSLNYLWTN